jgi:hypothetical protein
LSIDTRVRKIGYKQGTPTPKSARLVEVTQFDGELDELIGYVAVAAVCASLAAWRFGLSWLPLPPPGDTFVETEFFDEVPRQWPGATPRYCVGRARHCLSSHTAMSRRL